MSRRDYLIAKFPAEKGQAIRAVINQFDYLFHRASWKKEGDSVKLEGDICGPDSDDEGSRTRFLYDVDEIRLRMEGLGASVELHLAELIK